MDFLGQRALNAKQENILGREFKPKNMLRIHLVSISPYGLNPFNHQLIIKNRTAQNTPSAPATFTTLLTRPNLMELYAGIARGNDQAASEPRVLDSVQRPLFAPPRDAENHTAARPSEHGDTVRVLGLSEAECCGDFALASVKYQAGDLGIAVDRCQLSAGESMEEVDASVIAATARCDEGRLPWRERDCFARSVQREGVLLLSERDDQDVSLAAQIGCSVALAHCHRGAVDGGYCVRRSRYLLRLEQEEIVVITACREKIAIRTPRYAANLLCVASDSRE